MRLTSRRTGMKPYYTGRYFEETHIGKNIATPSDYQMYQVYSAKSNQGGRPQQQDRYFTTTLEKRSLYAVFDGHGEYGGDIAEFLKSKLALYLEQPDLTTDVNDKELITEVFRSLDESLKSASLDIYMSGSTCSIVIINMNGTITSGYIGDSSILICRKSDASIEPRYVSTNHNPEDPQERKRIEDNSGRISRNDPRIFD